MELIIDLCVYVPTWAMRGRRHVMRVRCKMAGIDESIQLRADDDDEFGVAADGELHEKMYKDWEISKPLNKLPPRL